MVLAQGRNGVVDALTDLKETTTVAIREGNIFVPAVGDGGLLRAFRKSKQHSWRTRAMSATGAFTLREREERCSRQLELANC